MTKYCRMILLMAVYLLTSISQYSISAYCEGKQFAKQMRSYSSKMLILNVSNFIFIKTCWVSESNQTASSQYSQNSSRAEIFRTIVLASQVTTDKSSCCTPLSSRPGTTGACHLPRTQDPSSHTQLLLASSRLHFRLLSAAQLLLFFL